MDFKGGSASTPSLSAYGKRIYLGDNFGKLLAIDTRTGTLIWELDLGDQTTGSVGTTVLLPKDSVQLFKMAQERARLQFDDLSELIATETFFRDDNQLLNSAF